MKSIAGLWFRTKKTLFCTCKCSKRDKFWLGKLATDMTYLALEGNLGGNFEKIWEGILRVRENQIIKREFINFG